MDGGMDGCGPFLFSPMGGRERVEQWVFIYLSSGMAFIDNIDVGFVVLPLAS